MCQWWYRKCINGDDCQNPEAHFYNNPYTGEPTRLSPYIKQQCQDGEAVCWALGAVVKHASSAVGECDYCSARGVRHELEQQALAVPQGMTIEERVLDGRAVPAWEYAWQIPQMFQRTVDVLEGEPKALIPVDDSGPSSQQIVRPAGLRNYSTSYVGQSTSSEAEFDPTHFGRAQSEAPQGQTSGQQHLWLNTSAYNSQYRSSQALEEPSANSYMSGYPIDPQSAEYQAQVSSQQLPWVNTSINSSEQQAMQQRSEADFSGFMFPLQAEAPPSTPPHFTVERRKSRPEGSKKPGPKPKKKGKGGA